MKSTLLILIGYITCTLKCEMNKTEAEEKTDNVEPLNENSQQGDVQQPKDAVPPEGKETADAGEQDKDRSVNVEQPENAKQPEGVETTDAVDTTDGVDTNTWYAVEQPFDIEYLEAAETTDAVYTTDAAIPIYAVEQPVYTERPEDVEKTDADDITDAVNTSYTIEQPVETEQPEDTETIDAVDITDAIDTTYAEDTTYAVEQSVDTERPEDTEKTEATKKQKIQADDTGPSKIRVEDALKILEKCKNKYALESIALIKKLKWLRSTFNITELMIDHKIDPNEDFDDLSDTQNRLNTSNILRKRVIDGFLHIKQAILDASNFKATVSSETKKERKMAKVKAEANRYKTNFIATHSDRENLEKIYLGLSD